MLSKELKYHKSCHTSDFYVRVFYASGTIALVQFLKCTTVQKTIELMIQMNDFKETTGNNYR